MEAERLEKLRALAQVLGLTTERAVEIVQLGIAVARYEIMPDSVADFHLTVDELRYVRAVARAWFLANNDQRAAERRARGLLRSLLSTSQRARLARSGEFHVTGSLGGIYRLRPRRFQVERIERHGSKWFARSSFCLHDFPTGFDLSLPPSDVCLQQMLLIRADEPGFFALANATDRGDMLWNGDWVRRCRQARREREQAA